VEFAYFTMDGDSGLTPGSGSVWDKGNRSPGLSFSVRFGLEVRLGRFNLYCLQLAQEDFTCSQ
jgi:hypothetical protein